MNWYIVGFVFDSQRRLEILFSYKPKTNYLENLIVDFVANGYYFNAT